MLRRLEALPLLLFALASAAASVLAQAPEPPAAAADGEAAYPLDGLSRSLTRAGAMPCSRRGLVRYAGESIAYARPVHVQPAFADRLRRLERLAVEVGRSSYGRAPRKLLHAGAFNCRRIQAYPDLLSEHALGNALDVIGFEFGPAAASDRLPARAPSGAFTVELGRHWDSRRAADQVHGAFLRAFARRVIEQSALFRVVLGPAWPGHRDHFHFDCAPYRLVAVF